MTEYHILLVRDTCSILCPALHNKSKFKSLETQTYTHNSQPNKQGKHSLKETRLHGSIQTDRKAGRLKLLTPLQWLHLI